MSFLMSNVKCWIVGTSQQVYNLGAMKNHILVIIIYNKEDNNANIN